MPENESPEGLIGRTVAFFWNSWRHKPLRLRGKVICKGRSPGTVIIEADTQNIPTHKNYSRQKAWSLRASAGGGLHCRPVCEVEVLA